MQTLGWLRPGLMSGVISTLRRVGIDSASLRRATESQAARDFLARAGKNAHWRLPIFLLPELQDLTEQDIRIWALEVMPSADEGERLARQLTGDDLDTAAIFERAAEALGSVGGLDDG